MKSAAKRAAKIARRRAAREAQAEQDARATMTQLDELVNAPDPPSELVEATRRAFAPTLVSEIFKPSKIMEFLSGKR